MGSKGVGSLSAGIKNGGSNADAADWADERATASATATDRRSQPSYEQLILWGHGTKDSAWRTPRAFDVAVAVAPASAPSASSVFDPPFLIPAPRLSTPFASAVHRGHASAS